MFRRPVEPHGTSGGPLTPWLVLGFAWLVAGALAPPTTTSALPFVLAVFEN